MWQINLLTVTLATLLLSPFIISFTAAAATVFMSPFGNDKWLGNGAD